jgi:hypothetical protein
LSFRRLGLHFADEADTPAGEGSDQPLLAPGVADRLACGIEATGDRQIRDHPAAPDRREEIALADDATGILHEVEQQIEYLGLDRNQCVAAAQLASIRVKCVIGKEKFHPDPSGKSDIVSSNNPWHLNASEPQMKD